MKKVVAVLLFVALFIVGQSKDSTAFAQVAREGEALLMALRKAAPESIEEGLRAFRASKPEITVILEKMGFTQHSSPELFVIEETTLLKALHTVSKENEVRHLGNTRVQELRREFPSEEADKLKEGLCYFLEDAKRQQRSTVDEVMFFLDKPEGLMERTKTFAAQVYRDGRKSDQAYYDNASTLFCKTQISWLKP